MYKKKNIKNIPDRELLEKIYISVEKTRIYFLWVLILSGIFFILPLLGLVFVIPMFLESFSQLNALGL